MAGKNTKKSNKTAHVLNLLTSQEDGGAAEVQGQAAVGKNVSTKAEASKTVRVENGNGAANPVSDKIKGELEKHFLSATAGEAAYAKHDINKEERSMEADSYVSVNIVEDVVKAKAPDFVAKLGGCACYRCVNDVIAMTLNSLPPKYTVTHKGTLFAKIGSYENQYSTDLTRALTEACMAVKESPRH